MMTSTKALVMRKIGNNEGRKPLPVREGVNFMKKIYIVMRKIGDDWTTPQVAFESKKKARERARYWTDAMGGDKDYHFYVEEVAIF